MKVNWYINQKESFINVPISINEANAFTKLYDILKKNNFKITNEQELVFKSIKEGLSMANFLNKPRDIDF